jgi:hypothetical protein
MKAENLAPRIAHGVSVQNLDNEHVVQVFAEKGSMMGAPQTKRHAVATRSDLRFIEFVYSLVV